MRRFVSFPRSALSSTDAPSPWLREQNRLDLPLTMPTLSIKSNWTQLRAQKQEAKAETILVSLLTLPATQSDHKRLKSMD
jgi:hypothetical protein